MGDSKIPPRGRQPQILPNPHETKENLFCKGEGGLKYFCVDPSLHLFLILHSRNDVQV